MRQLHVNISIEFVVLSQRNRFRPDISGETANISWIHHNYNPRFIVAMASITVLLLLCDDEGDVVLMMIVVSDFQFQQEKCQS
jgi:hypothetical protein